MDAEYQQLRELIHTRYVTATTDKERGRQLDAHRALNQEMEAQLDEDDRKLWRENAMQDYRLLLISEAVDAQGNVSPAYLLSVTRREVAAGRMDPRDELHQLAQG